MILKSFSLLSKNTRFGLGRAILFTPDLVNEERAPDFPRPSTVRIMPYSVQLYLDNKTHVFRP